MRLIQDIIFTVIDAGGLLYLLDKEKVSGKRKIIFVVAIIIIFCAITPLFTLADMRIKSMFSYGVPILLGVFVLKISVRKSVLYMGMGINLLFVSELVVVQIGRIFLDTSSIEREVSLPLIYSLTSKIVYIVLVASMQKILADVADNKIHFKSLLLFICSNMGYIIVAICVYANAIKIHDRRYNTLFLICCVTILLAFFANLIFSRQYLNLKNKEQEQEITIYKMQMETKYYEEKMREEERIKSIYHDLKNHILLLEGVEDKNQEWILEFKKKAIKYENYYRTGNKFLDIILKDKIEGAQTDNVKIMDDICFDEVDFLDPLDISTIFGNLLDNAIEACRAVEDIEQRVIKISARRRNHLLVIHASNSKVKDKRSRTRSGTSKRIIHGYGLLNVSNAVKKYDGEISIDEKESQFVVNIIIPMEGDAK